MGRRGISRDDMQNAIKIIESKHESVSAIAIRNELGTGSLTTIQNFLKERRDEQGEQHRVKREIPEDLTAASEAMLIKLWEIAESLASSDVEVLRKATTAEIDQLRSELTAVCESFDTMNMSMKPAKSISKRRWRGLMSLKRR